MPLFGKKGAVPLAKKVPVFGTAEGLREVAESTATSAQGTLGIQLDFTPGSLEVMDEAIDRFFEPGSPVIAPTVMSFGAYLGEVVIRNLGGRWRPWASWEDAAVVEIGSVAEVYPMRRMMKRMQEGPENSVKFWYETITKYRAPGDPGQP